MSPDFAELDFQPTPLGDLILRRRRLRSLDNREIFEIKLGEAFLMSSLFHDVEEALARLGIGALAPGEWDVVVGGLGLGYTAAAALDHEAVRSLTVVDFLQPVIDWHQRGLVPLGARLSADARCRFVCADFFALAASKAGFDPRHNGRRFHAILLDIDHSPENLLTPANASFYQPAGLRALATHLLPGGVFALWSDAPVDPAFVAALQEVFGSVRSHVVSFENPLLETDSSSAVYVATL